MFAIDRIDHFVLTVRSIEESAAFYQRVLRAERVDSPGLPTAIHFGQQKINLHEVGKTFAPNAQQATPGSGDFCVITLQSANAMLKHIADCGVELEVGPVERFGALGSMTSVYFRDPDQNLVEIATYAK